MADKTAKKGRQEVEILSPAGSYDILKTAVRAGADAIYAGGSCFGARAFAQNFTEEELLDAIDYVHLHGKKLYLTVNTLVKEREMEELSRYLRPFYEQGLDAVIVQDLGVMELIRERFPGLPIHASTQMTVTNSIMAEYLESFGVTRVVPARELSLPEIRKIADKTSLEIECFVHGALCYCYSGQCLLSSMIGGRSGNRGQCAQPCRLPWRIQDKEAAKGVPGEKPRDYLSLKDLCTIDLIPELIDAGITSFKIEGRMKQASYVETVVSMYRKYTDLYLNAQAGGRGDSFSVSGTDRQSLEDAFRRRGYTDGYYRRHNGKEMLSLARPEAKEGKNPRDTATAKEMQEKINGKLILSEGKSATLYLYADREEGPVSTKTEGAIVEKAIRQPVSGERLERQIRKTGGTPFTFDDLDIEIEGEVFLPIQAVNELRRDALLQLQEEITGRYRRHFKETEDCPERTEALGKESSFATGRGRHAKDIPVYVSVETKEQLACAVDAPDVRRIYVDDALYLAAPSRERENLAALISRARALGREVFFAMARIFRAEAEKVYEEGLANLLAMGDGMLVRNMESLRFLRGRDYEGTVIADSSAYQWNRRAGHFWEISGADGYVAPAELNVSELADLDRGRMELPVYGYTPVMVSAGCIRRHTDRCTKKRGWLFMSDRYQKEFAVKNECLYCYNVIYNTSPTMLGDQKKEIEELAPKALILAFSREDRQTMENVLSWFEKALRDGSKKPADWDGDFTRGHFKRGVK